WSFSHLLACNITVHNASPQQFFGYRPHTLPQNLDPAILTAELPPELRRFSDPTHRLLTYIDVIRARFPFRQSAIHDATREVLRTVGYESEEGIVLRSRYPLRLEDGDYRPGLIIPDLCLSRGDMSILLVVQQVGKYDTTCGYTEPQAIAAAIAAFQYNNTVRYQMNSLDQLKSMTIPAIIIVETCPFFYKIPVTAALSDAVAEGSQQRPLEETIVQRCAVTRDYNLFNQKMRSLEFRLEAFRYYEAFRNMAKHCWDKFIV
ncbi:hypothetical protein AN958_02299, partial [Leucoagaricus sp. SymC.cos]